MSEGTKTVDITNSQGHVTESTTTAVGTGDGIILDHWKAATGAGDIDSFGRPLTIRHFPSDTTQAWTIHRAYDCCGLVMETDRQGVATYQAYDVLRRQIKSNTLGVTTETVHRGLTTEIHRYPEAVTEGLSDFLLGVTADLTGRQTRNLSGTSTISESPNPADPTNGALVATTTETAYANGLATTTATAGRTYVDIKGIPTLTLGTGVQISISYPDGRTASTSGALQPAMYYTYSVNGTGLVTTSAYAGGFESTVTTTDLAGRTINVTKGTESTNYGYYSTTGVQGACGKLSSISDADTVRTLYDYNTKGERTTTALKLDNGTSIDYGTDQVTRTETLPAVRGTTSVLRTETNIWKDNAAVTTPTLVAYTERTPDGLDTWSWQLGVGESHTAATIGVFRTETTTSPDNTYSVTTYADGLPHTVERYASGGLSPLTTTTYGYESDLKRPTTVLDSRTGTATTAYISATCDAVKSVIDPGLRETIFTYDNQGRRTKVDAPDTTAGDNDTYTSYNPNGTVRSVSGAQYPVDYTYDYALRMKTMITHSSSTASATTAWNYSATTGRLLSKRYHSNPDGTPGTTGTGPDYTYTLAGRLATRKWARGIVTEYFYNCGLLATVYYSSAVGWAAYDVKRAAWQTMIDHPADYTLVQVSTAKSAMDAAYDARTDATMPPVNYNYNAFANDNNHIPGTIETVTRAGAVWTYTYDPTTLRPLSETQPVGGTAVTRILTRSTDSLGRPSGFSLGTGSQPYADHAVSYGYNDAGSLNAVTGAGKTFNYGYTYSQAAATDPRVGDTTTNANKQDFMPYTLTGPQHFATRTYEATRDALASIENIVGGTTVSKYTYSVNPLGQRGGVATAGSAFGGVNRGWTWSYDARGQVTAAQNTTVTNYNRAYTFDAIGNRLTSVGSSGTTYYNSGTNDNLYADPFLNQYFAIAAPGATPVAKPAYDADGNLLADAGVNAKPYGLKFGWDSENRITSVCKTTPQAPR